MQEVFESVHYISKVLLFMLCEQNTNLFFLTPQWMCSICLPMIELCGTWQDTNPGLSTKNVPLYSPSHQSDLGILHFKHYHGLPPSNAYIFYLFSCLALSLCTAQCLPLIHTHSIHIHSLSLSPSLSNTFHTLRTIQFDSNFSKKVEQI